MADRSSIPAEYNSDTAGTPFDQIKHTDADGDYWLARELMPLMAYARWEDFAKITFRAKMAARNAGHDADQAFSEIAAKVTDGRPRADFRLTRYAAYLVAMNGDPNKPEVAAAQTYFATRTREAELASNEREDLPQWARQQIETIVRVGKIETEQRRQGERLTDVESRVGELEATPDWFTALGYARLKNLNCSPAALRQLGRVAAKVCREQGVAPDKTHDSRFGEVGVYPKSALDAAAERIATHAA